MVKNKINRRRVLSSIGVGSIINGVGMVSAGSDTKKEIVTDKVGDEPLNKELVSEDWYIHVEAVREAQEELYQLTKTDDEVTAVGRKATGAKVDGLKKKNLDVRVIDENNDEGGNIESHGKLDIPEQVNGIPVDISKEKSDNLKFDDHIDDGWCNEESVSCARGGNIISTTYTNSSDDCSETWGRLTATGAVELDGDTFMMTSAHGFYNTDDYSEYCGKDITGPLAGQGNACNDGTQYIGSVEEYSHSQDFALINTELFQEISSGVVAESGKIGGHVSEDGVDYLSSNETDVYKYGARSCYSSGKVIGDYTRDRCGEEVKWIQLTTNAGSGDSGAPHYRRFETPTPYNDFLSLIGPHTQHSIDDDGEHNYSYVPAAYGINNEHNVEFKQI